MLAKGKIIQSESGHNFRVDQFISAGGQAEVYKVSNITTREKMS